MTAGHVAILVPMDVEVRPVVAALPVRRVDDERAATWSGRTKGTTRTGGIEISVHMIGIGPARARSVTEHVVATYEPDRLVVCGIAGGLGPATLGELVVPAEVIDGTSGERHRAHGWGPLVPEGALVTTDGMWSSDRLEGHRSTGVRAVDMETAAVAAVAARHGLPWIAVRAISDLVSEGTVDGSTLALTRPDGRSDVRAALRHVGGAPWRVPGLVRIATDTRRATRVATAAVVAAVGAEA